MATLSNQLDNYDKGPEGVPTWMAMLEGHFGLGPVLGWPFLAWLPLASPLAVPGVPQGTHQASQMAPRHGFPGAKNAIS